MGVAGSRPSHFDAGTAYVAFDRHTFGDMTPYVYKTTDYGKTWTRIVGARRKGVRGYAHVIKEDTVKPDLLFVGTEFGLWISIDGGAHWAQFKGGDFPAVAVRDLAVQPRDARSRARDARPRHLDHRRPHAAARARRRRRSTAKRAFLPARPVAAAHAARSAAGPRATRASSAPTRPAAPMITYYQRARHLFGKLKLEVLDAKGKLIDTLPASKRRGINRVTWSMRVKPPRVPPRRADRVQLDAGPARAARHVHACG